MFALKGRGRWRTNNYEEVYLHEYASPKEAYRLFFQYIQFYNSVRLHQSLEYRTPVQVYDGAVPAVHSTYLIESIETLVSRYSLI